MARTDEVMTYLGDYLRIGEVPDYPGALNGLQLANDGTVSRIGAAVDACLPVVREAVARGIDFLIVHHGMFWSGAQRIEGGYYEKLKAALDGNLAIYSAHLPLDVHETVGNNVVLADALGMGETAPFMEWKGIHVGRRARVEMRLEELVEKVSAVVGGGTVHVCAGGSAEVRELGVVTGGAGGEVAQAAAEGVDTLVTGEGPHWSYTAAEELGINVLYAGHYATETFGVKCAGGACGGARGGGVGVCGSPDGVVTRHDEIGTGIFCAGPGGMRAGADRGAVLVGKMRGGGGGDGGVCGGGGRGVSHVFPAECAGVCDVA